MLDEMQFFDESHDANPMQTDDLALVKNRRVIVRVVNRIHRTYYVVPLGLPESCAFSLPGGMLTPVTPSEALAAKNRWARP